MDQDGKYRQRFHYAFFALVDCFSYEEPLDMKWSLVWLSESASTALKILNFSADRSFILKVPALPF
jgi:hypothetical protein